MTDIVSSRANSHAESVYCAGQWTLMWRRFLRHRLAVVGGVIVLLLYVISVGAGFFAYADPEAGSASRSLIPPQPIALFNEGRFEPHVLGLKRVRDPQTFQLVYTPDPENRIPVRIFGEGFQYRLFGLFPTNIHLITATDEAGNNALNLAGTDVQGRDFFSRMVFATRVSMTIGLVGVTISLLLGVTLGAISGLYGGLVDETIQRIIDILNSIPTIPLWMGIAASVPPYWEPTQVYFAVTIIISLIGWTDLARVTRGRFLAMRTEDFVTAARLDGASEPRVIFKHMVPSFLSHIIAATTLAVPAMILSETALSFLGLGLRPPAISWGVLLQQSQNVQAIAMTPWLLLAAIPVIVAVLAFNFLGDGIRDAADPYSR
ncbi:ABC transporter permease [Mesorhizobium sp.]|uniref:ABC transporter permease n=1 Tax=Mesorhizobium sp. TaxID=1871066 RepID=UPI000FE596A5|nr:ABC transporter permease [Mesorhizobium sp.]RWK63382.1 MAG: ABC transporter permease [Mesorhizobium sp.]